jgi:hypothetical protein
LDGYWLVPSEQAEQRRRRKRIKQAVRAALEELTDDEREFIQRFYYSGETYQFISDRSGRSIHKLESLHSRAIKKLRKLLAPLAQELFGIRSDPAPDCVICDSPHRYQIDKIIRVRDRQQTWRPVLREIRDRFGVHIKSPQTLIGHERYH